MISHSILVKVKVAEACRSCFDSSNNVASLCCAHHMHNVHTWRCSSVDVGINHISYSSNAGGLCRIFLQSQICKCKCIHPLTFTNSYQFDKWHCVIWYNRRCVVMQFMTRISSCPHLLLQLNASDLFSIQSPLQLISILIVTTEIHGISCPIGRIFTYIHIGLILMVNVGKNYHTWMVCMWLTFLFLYHKKICHLNKNSVVSLPWETIIPVWQATLWTRDKSSRWLFRRLSICAWQAKGDAALASEM